MTIEEEKEAKIQTMLMLNDELLEAVKQEFLEYIQIIDNELERRNKK